MMERMLTDYDPRIRPDYSGTMWLLMISNANRGDGGWRHQLTHHYPDETYSYLP